jgi:hypothetical protein
LVVKPYFRQWAPPEFSATLPPIVQTIWLEGSGAKYRSCGATSAEMPALVTPGWTTARWFATSTDRIARIRARPMTRPSATGSAPPDRPVPAPRATNGTWSRAHSRTTAATSSVVAGSTTSAGVTR